MNPSGVSVILFGKFYRQPSKGFCFLFETFLPYLSIFVFTHMYILKLIKNYFLIKNIHKSRGWCVTELGFRHYHVVSNQWYSYFPTLKPPV